MWYTLGSKRVKWWSDTSISQYLKLFMEESNAAFLLYAHLPRPQSGHQPWQKHSNLISFHLTSHSFMISNRLMANRTAHCRSCWYQLVKVMWSVLAQNVSFYRSRLGFRD